MSMTVVFDKYDILDSYSTPIGNVQTRLNSHNVACLQRVVRELPKKRRFVNPQTDGMSGAMNEILVEVLLGEHVPRRSINAACLHTGGNHRDRGDLGFGNQTIYDAKSGRGLSHPDRAREIAAVAANARAHVDDHRFPGLNSAISRRVMRSCGIGTRGDDSVECLTLAPKIPKLLVDESGQLHFRHPLLEVGGGALERNIGEV